MRILSQKHITIAPRITTTTIRTALHRARVTCALLTLLAPAAAGFTNVYFSPDDAPVNALIAELNNARERIWCAVYTITHPRITAALIAAHKRGVSVSCVSDKSTGTHSSHKHEELTKAGISIALYDDPSAYKSYNSIMHHKFAIIDHTVWTGSMNWTKSGAEKNQENSLHTDDCDVVTRYEAQFEKVRIRARGADPRMSEHQGEAPTLREALVNSVQRLLSVISALPATIRDSISGGTGA